MSNLVTTGKPLSSMANLSTTDFTFERCVIGQPMTKRYEPGKFCLTTGENTETLENIVPLYVTKSRVLFSQKEQGAYCKSDNGCEPSPGAKNIVYQGPCEYCPASKWGEDDPEKQQLCLKLGKPLGNAPLCKETYNLWFVFENSSQPVCLSLMGSQVSAAKSLFSAFAMRGLELFQAKVTLKLKKIEQKQGIYYQMYFEGVEKLDDCTLYENIFTALTRKAESMLADANEKSDQELRSEKTVGKKSPLDGTKWASSPKIDDPMPTDKDAPEFDSNEEIPF